MVCCPPLPLPDSTGKGLYKTVQENNTPFLFLFRKKLFTGILRHHPGIWDAFVCKISSDGSTLVYSSYLGGTNQEDRINAGTPGSIAVDSTGAAYVTGDTQSDDFPVLNAYQPSLIGTSDIFITKISPSGSSILYSTYLGGERTEAGFGIAVDSKGVAYIVGIRSLLLIRLQIRLSLLAYRVLMAVVGMLSSVQSVLMDPLLSIQRIWVATAWSMLTVPSTLLLMLHHLHS